jgi:hypothetical protein
MAQMPQKKWQEDGVFKMMTLRQQLLCRVHDAWTSRRQSDSLFLQSPSCRCEMSTQTGSEGFLEKMPRV